MILCAKIKGIYKITSPVGAVYIGQSIDINKRWRMYLRYACKSQPKLYASLRKYGAENHTFAIAHELPGDIEGLVLDEYEQIYLDTYRQSGYEMLNVCPTAGGTMRGFRHSEVTKNRMSEIRKGKKTTSDFQRKRISECNKSRVVTDSTRKKISKSRIGVKPWNKGITHSDETKRKLSIQKKGVKRPPFTEETRRRMSIAFTGRKRTPEAIKKTIASKKLNRLKRSKQIPIWQ